jgi:Zn finger protein HypA/HybF involved in hydrogenase expression
VGKPPTKIPDEIPVEGLGLHPVRPAWADCRCPKCKSRSMSFKEHWHCSIEFIVTNGWLDRANGNMHPDGDPYKVTATCAECNHRWTIRGASQITDVCVDAGADAKED